jgi:hypothetical protein
MVMNAASGTTAPTAVAMPTTGTNGCAGAFDALKYNTTTHALGCNTISGGGLPAFTSGVGYDFVFGFSGEAGPAVFVAANNQIVYWQFLPHGSQANRLIYQTAAAPTSAWSWAIYDQDCSTRLATGNGTTGTGVISVTLSGTVTFSNHPYVLALSSATPGTSNLYTWASTGDTWALMNKNTNHSGVSSTAWTGTWPASGTNLCSGSSAFSGLLHDFPEIMLEFQ